jgi:DNA-directed RNA polymerase specialized sigma24 family protein
MNRLLAETLHEPVKPELSPDVSNGIAWGLYGIGSWPPPPNWNSGDWHREIRAVAVASALDAVGNFDAARGVPLSGFICKRVKARTLTRYRQEWRYAQNTKTTEPELMEQLACTSTATWTSSGVFESLNWALDRLEKAERWLLRQIFWHQRTEALIAAELQVSQPAVNKRKHQALARLRAVLREEDRAGLRAVLQRSA